jgi:hypothetical protein
MQVAGRGTDEGDDPQAHGNASPEANQKESGEMSKQSELLRQAELQKENKKLRELLRRMWVMYEAIPYALSDPQIDRLEMDASENFYRLDDQAIDDLLAQME